MVFIIKIGHFYYVDNSGKNNLYLVVSPLLFTSLLKCHSFFFFLLL